MPQDHALGKTVLPPKICSAGTAIVMNKTKIFIAINHFWIRMKLNKGCRFMTIFITL